VNAAGVGGQTAVFHAVTQFADEGCRWCNCSWSVVPTSRSA